MRAAARRAQPPRAVMPIVLIMQSSFFRDLPMRKRQSKISTRFSRDKRDRCYVRLISGTVTKATTHAAAPDCGKGPRRRVPHPSLATRPGAGGRENSTCIGASAPNLIMAESSASVSGVYHRNRRSISAST